VPAGTSRLRLSVMASHTKSELREAAQVLAKVVPKAPRRPAADDSGRVFDGLRDAA
jgi:hypothetical protein